MKYQAEKIPPKKTKPMFLFITRYCDKCMLAFWWQKVKKTKYGSPACPECGESIWVGEINKMRIKKP